MERRRFIKNLSLTAAAGIVLPTIIPSSALGKGGIVAPSDRVVMALVGCASMGQSDMMSLLASKQVECIALCDVHKPRIKITRDAFTEKGYKDDQKEYEDYRDLIAKEKMDAVVIAVPDHWHALLYTEFANSKIDVYGEKPLVRKLKEGRVVVDAVKKNNIIWQTGSWQRSTSQFVKACNLIASGAIGEVKNVEVGLPDLKKKAGMPDIKKVPSSLNYDLWQGPAKDRPYRGILHWDWRWMMEYSGGQITDWVGHHMDIAGWSLGLDKTGPSEIDATATFVQGDLFDVPREFKVNLAYQNGVKITMANSSQLEKGMGVRWFGENGSWIHVSRRGIWASDEKILDAPIDASKDRFSQNDGNHWDNFIAGVRTRKAPIADVEGAHRAVSAALLGEVAYVTGEKLKWNPITEELIGASAEANAMLTRSYRKPWSLKGL